MDLGQGQAIYEKVAEMIENDILRGALKPQDQAPSTNAFASIYQMNPATARKGLNILVDEGILYKKRGMGMYVTDHAPAIISKKRRQDFQDRLLPGLLQEARRLGFGKEELIEMIKEAGND